VQLKDTNVEPSLYAGRSTNNLESKELLVFASEMRDSGGIMKKVFDMICNEASFLVSHSLNLHSD